MKLHLPTGLRSALFACFAAVASLGATLATATVAGGVFAVTLASSVAEADDYNGVAGNNMVLSPIPTLTAPLRICPTSMSQATLSNLPI